MTYYQLISKNLLRLGVKFGNMKKKFNAGDTWVLVGQFEH